MNRVAQQPDLPDGFAVVPSGAPLGADVVGVDLAAPIGDTTFAHIRDAWHQHQVLRFRGQSLDNRALAAFSRRFGPLDLAPTGNGGTPPIPDEPEIAVISNVVEDGKPRGSLGNSELVWHQDMSYTENPPMASLLYGIEVAREGGETLFHSLYDAYENLPSALRSRLATLTCKHDATRNSSGVLRHGFDAHYSNEARPGAVHPMVIRHPETGRPALCLGRRPNAWIVGLSDADSDALLDEVWSHVETRGPHWVHEWQVGDLVIWDNRCVLHRREALDPGQRRHMHRTQVRDSRPPEGVTALLSR